MKKQRIDIFYSNKSHQIQTFSTDREFRIFLAKLDLTGVTNIFFLSEMMENSDIYEIIDVIDIDQI